MQNAAEAPREVSVCEVLLAALQKLPVEAQELVQQAAQDPAFPQGMVNQISGAHKAKCENEKKRRIEVEAEKEELQRQLALLSAELEARKGPTTSQRIYEAAAALMSMVFPSNKRARRHD